MSNLPVVNFMGDISVKPGFVLEKRTIPDYELVYFPAATNTIYEIGDKQLVLNEPCLLFTRPQVPHQYTFDPKAVVRHIFVHFELEPLLAQGEEYSKLLTLPDFIRLPLWSIIPSTLRHMLFVAHRRPDNWRRRLSVLLLSVLEEVLVLPQEAERGTDTTLPPQISKALTFIEQHLHKPISIAEVAANSGWTHEHFTRMFIKFVGVSPQQSLLDRRLKRAEQLLLYEEWTIKRVAHEVGFGDEYHFSKMFRRTRGMTASAFRERYANPLFKHLAASEELDSPYPLNRMIFTVD